MQSKKCVPSQFLHHVRVTEYACTTWMVQSRSLSQCDLLKQSKGGVNKDAEAASSVTWETAEQLTLP